MNDKEKQEAFAAFLAARKHPIEPRPGFSDQVMASAAAWERSRAANPSERSARAPAWPEGLRRYLFGSFGGRSALAFAMILMVSVPVSIRYFHEAGADLGTTPGDSTRIKGGAFRLGFLLKRGNRIEPAVPGGAFLPGDRLQAVYSSPFSGYLQLFSVSSNGEVTCISCQAASEKLIAGQSKSLPYALELDSGKADEAMIALLTEKPLARESSAQALAAAWEDSRHDLGKIGAHLKSLLPVQTMISVFPIRKTRGAKSI